jgi:L-arabinose isomerase
MRKFIHIYSYIYVGGTYKYAQAGEVEVNKTKLWNQLCEQYKVPLPAVALKFGLLYSAIGACAVGVKNPNEVLQIVEWFHCVVPIELFIEAKERGLLAAHVPL